MTKLQKLLKASFEESKMNENSTYEKWKESVFKFGKECYIKAMQGKLIEVDYRGGYRNVRGEN